eukprot:12356227-Heterocapsa_arctica.AAC.1
MDHPSLRGKRAGAGSTISDPCTFVCDPFTIVRDPYTMFSDPFTFVLLFGVPLDRFGSYFANK